MVPGMPSITFHGESRTWVLHGTDMAYALRWMPSGHLAHVHWGAALPGTDAALAWLPLWRDGTSHVAPPGYEDGLFNLNTLPQEMPVAGGGDFRSPMVAATDAQGQRTLDLRVAGHRILSGKPALPGLPATYVESDAEATTLEIVLRDAASGLEIALLWTVVHGTSAIVRSWRATNTGSQPVRLDTVLSASVDLPPADRSLVHLTGSWGREFEVRSHPLAEGVCGFGSRRGISSHQHNPFIAVTSRDCTDEHGEVMAMSLVYSGDFTARAEVDPAGTTRLQIGMGADGFSWHLAPGEVFQAPEAVLVYARDGLGGMSRTYHRLYRSRLARGPWRDHRRPVVINNWEATYFDFSHQRLVALAEAAHGIGCEVLVLDDGWFGRRDDDTSSLGDWDVIHARKLPHGLAGLAADVAKAGLQLGLWFEPEMVSPDSDLHRRHPDWVLNLDGRPGGLARNQLVLDLGREEVVEHVWQAMASVLRSAPIVLLKWDMNRPLSEIGSRALPPDRQGEASHRRMLGVYAIMERLHREFPGILVEGCASGGGRCDPGMLHYQPYLWISDCTDAIERARIQLGASLVYPPSCMDANISAVPNHQTGRTIAVEVRAAVATTGTFGFQLDLLALPPDERQRLKAMTARWRQLERTIRSGTLYRLSDSGNERWMAWMSVSDDRRSAVITCVQALAQANGRQWHLRPRGLDPQRTYRVDQLLAPPSIPGPSRTSAAATSFTASGAALLAAGLRLPCCGDAVAWCWNLTATPDDRNL
jgi:alpha-galactosidase